MPNYQQGKIYKIVCNISGLVYYGSTCEPTLARRLVGHRGSFESWKRGVSKDYVRSYDCLKNENYDIVLVELYPCNSKMELHKRERFFIENNACVNIAVPSRTCSEYKSDNREEINKKQKIYYRSHLKNNVYECECGKITTVRHHLRHESTIKHIAFIDNKSV